MSHDFTEYRCNILDQEVPPLHVITDLLATNVLKLL